MSKISMLKWSQSDLAESLLPTTLPSGDGLRPAANLPAIFDECHNYIYANEGLLKDKIFCEKKP